MGRVIIYGYLFFPRESASANFVQYLALALKEVGYSEVIVISNGNKQLCQYDSGKQHYYYKGIVVDFIQLHSGKFRHYLDYNYRRGIMYARAIEKYKINHEDLIIGYCSDCLEMASVQKLAKKYNAKTAACIPEYFSYTEFKHGRLSLKYWCYNYTLKHTLIKNDYLFPISTYILEKYKHCNAMCLPIMADPFEYPYERTSSNNKRKIIYPSNGKIKDSLASMLNAISELSDEELGKLELHITGVRREDIDSYQNEKLSSLIGSVIILHSWMRYEELVKLYLSIDFLLLARETTQMTLANFPSKVPEVLCYGVVPIVSRVGDYTKYYLTDGVDSIIFDGSGVADCIEAIRRALSLSKEEIRIMSNNARKCAIKKFNYKIWATKLLGFFNNYI